MFRKNVIRILHDQIGVPADDPDKEGRLAIMDVINLFPVSPRVPGRGNYHAKFGHKNRYRVIGAAMSRGMSPYQAEKIFTNVPGMSQSSKEDVKNLIARNVAGLYGERDTYVRDRNVRKFVESGGPIVFHRGGPGAGYNIKHGIVPAKVTVPKMSYAAKQRMYNDMHRRLISMPHWAPRLAAREKELKRRGYKRTRHGVYKQK
jgi:hypothetical protein